MTRVRLCFHDRCFDGTASAALFYRFYKETFDPTAEFGFTGMTHRAQQPWTPGLFDGDENVIVDFKYSNSPKSYLVVRPSSERVSHARGCRTIPQSSWPAHVLRAGI